MSILLSAIPNGVEILNQIETANPTVGFWSLDNLFIIFILTFITVVVLRRYDFNTIKVVFWGLLFVY